MNTRKNLIFLACFLSIGTSSYAGTFENQLRACTVKALKSNVAYINDADEAISQALAACDKVHKNYSQALLEHLQGLGYSSSNHINALISVHSYRTALTYLNQNYLALKDVNHLDT